MNEKAKVYAGLGLIIISLAALASNMSDTIADLHNWHDASTPQFVAALLKQIGGVVTAAIGGNLLPTVGAK